MDNQSASKNTSPFSDDDAVTLARITLNKSDIDTQGMSPQQVWERFAEYTAAGNSRRADKQAAEAARSERARAAQDEQRRLVREAQVAEALRCGLRARNIPSDDLAVDELERLLTA